MAEYQEPEVGDPSRGRNASPCEGKDSGSFFCNLHENVGYKYSAATLIMLSELSDQLCNVFHLVFDIFDTIKVLGRPQLTT
jgi:hypothetical protein